MGFFDAVGDFMKSQEKNILQSKYGIKRPYDAVNAVDRILRSGRDDDEKASLVRPVIAWLRKAALSGDYQAESALDDIRSSHRSFMEYNEIDI